MNNDIDPTDYDDVTSLIERGLFEEAKAKCLPLADGGLPTAQLYLGWMFQTGKGTARNLDEAERWYQRALAENAPKAEFYLGTVSWERDDIARALQLFEKSASHDYVPAIYRLGERRRDVV